MRLLYDGTRQRANLLRPMPARDESPARRFRGLAGGLEPTWAMDC